MRKSCVNNKQIGEHGYIPFGKIKESWKLVIHVQCSRFDIALDELWGLETEEHFDLFELLENKKQVY